MIAVQKFPKHYKNLQVLDDMRFSVPTGELFAYSGIIKIDMFIKINP